MGALMAKQKQEPAKPVSAPVKQETKQSPIVEPKSEQIVITEQNTIEKNSEKHEMSSEPASQPQIELNEEEKSENNDTEQIKDTDEQLRDEPDEQENSDAENEEEIYGDDEENEENEENDEDEDGGEEYDEEDEEDYDEEGYGERNWEKQEEESTLFGKQLKDVNVSDDDLHTLIKSFKHFKDRTFICTSCAIRPVLFAALAKELKKKDKYFLSVVASEIITSKENTYESIKHLLDNYNHKRIDVEGMYTSLIDSGLKREELFFKDHEHMKRILARIDLIDSYVPRPDLDEECWKDFAITDALTAIHDNDVEKAKALVQDEKLTATEVLSRCIACDYMSVDIAKEMVALGASPTDALAFLMDTWAYDNPDLPVEKYVETIVHPKLDFLQELGASMNNTLVKCLELYWPLDTFKKLIKLGADVNKEERNILDELRHQNSRMERTELLLDAGLDISRTVDWNGSPAPLFFSTVDWEATHYEQTYLATKLFMKRGIDINTPVVIRGETLTLLTHFAKIGNIRGVRFLIGEGVDINHIPQGGKHVLLLVKPTVPGITELVSLGADLKHLINLLEGEEKQRVENLLEKDKDAAIAEIVRILKIKEIYKQKDSLGPKEFSKEFHTALQEGNLECIKVFVSLGEDPRGSINVRDSSRVGVYSHPLILVASSGNGDSVKYLLDDCNVDPLSARFSEIQDGRHHTLKRDYNGAIAVFKMDFVENRKLILSLMDKLQSRGLLNESVATYVYSGERQMSELRGMTYLHYFATQKNEAICRELIKRGADANYTKDDSLPSAIKLWPEVERIAQRESEAIPKLGKLALQYKHSDIKLFVY